MCRSLLGGAVVAVMLFLAQAVMGEVIILDSTDTGVTVAVEEPNDSTIALHFTIGSFGRDAVPTDSGTCYRVRCNKEGFLMNDSTDGKPELPLISRSIIIPDCDSITVSLDSSEYSDFANFPVIPSRGQYSEADPENYPFEFGDIYGESVWYPDNPVYHRDLFKMRDYHGVEVALNAFQANPALDLLRVYNSVWVTITCHNPQNISVGNLVYEFDKIYNRRFINYSLHKTQATEEMVPGDLLVIAPDAFYDHLSEFADWKRQKGINTTLLNMSDIGNDSSSIIDTIHAYYDRSDLAYVLLAGTRDSIYVPSCSLWIYNIQDKLAQSDLIYSLVDGYDDYPDVFIGRFSICDTSDALLTSDRITYYERNMTGSNWLDKAVCIGEVDERTPDYIVPHMDTIKSALLDMGYSQADTFFVPDGEDHTAELSDNINDGRGLIFYMGHGGIGGFPLGGWMATGFNTQHVNSLNNINELPFVFSCACDNGVIPVCGGQGAVFGSSWIMANNNSLPTGAIGTYMSSDVSRWIGYYAMDEFVESIAAGDLSLVGSMCFNASLDMKLKMPLATDIFKSWIIHGDPSLQLRTKNPDNMTVSFPESVNHNASSIAVSVQNLEGALCALSQDGKLYGSAYTDENGDATIDIIYDDCMYETVPLILTVTAFNKVTSIGSITVILDSCLCGDANGDSNVNVLDVSFITNYLYNGGPAPCPYAAADVNSDSNIDILDMTYLINYLYKGGPAPNCAVCIY